MKGALKNLVLSKTMAGFSGVKGKTVKVCHMPAVAVIGDERCSMPLFESTKRMHQNALKGEGAVIRKIRKSESLPYALVSDFLLEHDPEK